MTTLDELVKVVLDIKLRDPDPDDVLAMLHMADCAYDSDGKPLATPTLDVVALDVGPGFVIAPVVRLMIATCEPSCVVVALPSWHAKLPVGQTLQTYGVSEVRFLPPDMVQDSLVIIGEDAAGMSLIHTYVIERDADANRVWVKAPQATGWSSRFDQLFVLPKLMDQALPHAQQYGLSPQEARRAAKNAVLDILREDAAKALARDKRERP